MNKAWQAELEALESWVDDLKKGFPHHAEAISDAVENAMQDHQTPAEIRLSAKVATKPWYWYDQLTECQLYKTRLGSVMYDANLPGIGWCNCGEAAFEAFGGRLGLGLGQRYELQADGRWLKTEG